MPFIKLQLLFSPQHEALCKVLKNNKDLYCSLLLLNTSSACRSYLWVRDLLDPAGLPLCHNTSTINQAWQGGIVLHPYTLLLTLVSGSSAPT